MPRVQIELSNQEMKEMLFRTKADNIAKAVKLVVDSFLEDKNLMIDVSDFNRELKKVAEESLKYAAEQIISEFNATKEKLKNTYEARYRDIKKIVDDEIAKIASRHEEIEELIKEFEKRLDEVERKAEVFKKAEEIIKHSENADKPLVIADKVSEMSKMIDIINEDIDSLKKSVKELKLKFSRIPKPCQHDYQFNKFIKELYDNIKNLKVPEVKDLKVTEVKDEEDTNSPNTSDNNNSLSVSTNVDRNNQDNRDDEHRKTIQELIEKEINPILVKTIGLKLTEISEGYYQFSSDNPLVVMIPRKEVIPLLYELIKAKIGDNANVELMDTGIRFLVQFKKIIGIGHLALSLRYRVWLQVWEAQQAIFSKYMGTLPLPSVPGFSHP